MNVLLTGYSGFLGGAIYKALCPKYTLSLILRENRELVNNVKNIYYLGGFSGSSDFSLALNGIECVIHAAALAHKVNIDCPRQSYYEVNTLATLKLARQAAEQGVKRFIFISSIGVNGASNKKPFLVDDALNPTDSYSISKYEAEEGLNIIAQETGLEVVIIRPPLIYGKNAPGNFGTLLKIANKNLPLPLGAINNERSFVALDNLIDLIETCIEHPNAANQIFLVSDDENISTSNFLKKMILALGLKPWLLPVPVSFLKFVALIFGKKALVERFSSSLTVNIEHTKKTLNWKPPITLDEGIRRCFK
ncbi:NAD-dependent epimerase/dehydratase family protein [Shewanella baltica]|uniref:NAD-dependent epimerase/dehydratase family protein n=1 Tax=Shewanella baltica TaxID=62322 RepID=UPI00217EC51D|nr:NAD-dependent epimerase/dehydratase family protein [Shewanella baltica]MCS6237814.1 NAD-dependent epimerase/dehydratase family protein [Shewanella baltica]MCS6261896.1 NAD-dependent epimerase/dehydratase family protein [Shewanella baltica]MCS6272474.1 NAD-dependent epimerase/dehydratase family protein [Shewanella baltica]